MGIELLPSHAPFRCRGFAARFREAGFAIVPRVFDQNAVEELRAAIAAIPSGEEVRRKRSVYGVRNLLEISPAVRQLAASPLVHQFVTPILGEGAFAARAVFFDKVPDANWTLGWHQDSVISVAEKKTPPVFWPGGKKPAFGRCSRRRRFWPAWSRCGCIWTTAARTMGRCGCFLARIVPAGWMRKSKSGNAGSRKWSCTVDEGGLVLMCPLTLHASSKAISPSHRRVIHIEFANEDLPNRLTGIRRSSKSRFQCRKSEFGKAFSKAS